MNTKQARQTDVWEKWDWLWHALFYTTVLVSAALMLRDQNLTVHSWLPLLLTAILLL